MESGIAAKNHHFAKTMSSTFSSQGLSKRHNVISAQLGTRNPAGKNHNVTSIPQIGIRRRQTIQAVKQTIRSHPTYALLIFVPLGIAAGLLEWTAPAIFALNLLSIIPLAMFLSFLTEELSTNLRQSLGALLNATFGNAVELIVSIIALTKGEIRIVQANMLGAVLSSLLLGLGCCFIVGGVKEDCQFNDTAAQTMSSLLIVASVSLVIPAMLNAAFDDGESVEAKRSVLILSRGTSIVLLVLYVLYLYFQLGSHAKLFEQSQELDEKGGHNNTNTNGERKEVKSPPTTQQASLSPRVCIASMLLATALIAISADFLVGTVDELAATTGINKTFIGLIILPIVGNAAEQATAVAAAARGKADLCLGVAIGSSLQVALFVTPALVVLGWVMDQPMSLCFDPFEAVVFFLSVLVVCGLIGDGESNYLEGAMLVGTYVILAIAFYVYPVSL